MKFQIMMITLIVALAQIPSYSYSMYAGPDCNEIGQVGGPYFSSKIAFVSNIGSKSPDNFTLYTINSDGSGGLEKIGKLSYTYPVFISSDGKEIVFTALVNGTNQVLAGKTDGSAVYPITHDDMSKSAIGVTPDGKKIIYAAHPSSESYVITNFFSIDSDGKNLVALTNESSEKDWPAVSSDGSTVVFDIYNKTNSKIYAVKTDGSNLHYVTDGSLFSHVPAVISSDGSKIVFSRNNPTDSNSKYIFVGNTVGTGVVKLIPYAIYEASDFAISPDGSKVAIDDYNMKDNYNYVSVINSDSTGYTRILPSSYFFHMAILSQDGAVITFMSPNGTKVGLYDSNTSTPQPLEIDRGNIGGVFMSNDNSKIIFSKIYNGTTLYLSSLDGKIMMPLIKSSDFTPDHNCKIPYGGPIEMSSVTTPEFPFAVPVLLISIISSIVFYRMKFRK
jgi:Tol biopolymer transport system component